MTSIVSNRICVSVYYFHVQLEKGSGNLSTLSVTEAVAYTSSGRLLAVYRGLNVVVYTVNKTELNLTRQDLVELITVCILFSNCCFDLCVYCICLCRV